MLRVLALYFFLQLFVVQPDYAQLRRFNPNKFYEATNQQVTNFHGERTEFGSARQFVSFEVGGGFAAYLGDIHFSSKFITPTIDISTTYRLGKRFQVRGGFVWSQLNGDDFVANNPQVENQQYHYVRNLQFRNNVKEFYLKALFDVFPSYFAGSRVLFTPFVGFGAGLIHHNPQGLVPTETRLAPGEELITPERAGTWVQLRDLQTEGEKYSPVSAAIPFTLGFRFYLADHLDVEINADYHYFLTDYIDDIKGKYQQRQRSELSQVMANRSLEPYAVQAGGDRLAMLPRNSSVQPEEFGAPGTNRGTNPLHDSMVAVYVRLVYIMGPNPIKKVKITR